MAEKWIGVVGGVGPFAGIDLLGKIAAETIANQDQDHLTALNWSQPAKIVDRTEYLLGQVAENPAGALAAQVQQLPKWGGRCRHPLQHGSRAAHLQPDSRRAGGSQLRRTSAAHD